MIELSIWCVLKCEVEKNLMILTLTAAPEQTDCLYLAYEQCDESDDSKGFHVVNVGVNSH